jgi:hypothetical protein
MAQDKNSFLLYCDLWQTVKKMPTDKAGELFKHILSYVNDENPNSDDLIIQLTFEPIKQQLKRDLKKYSKSVENKSNAGKLGNLKRWNKDLHDSVLAGKLNLDEALIIAESRRKSQTDVLLSQTFAEIADNVSDSVNVSVSDNDSVNVNDIKDKSFNDILLKKETKKNSENKNKKLEIVNPFHDELFFEHWIKWKEYKKAEKGFKFKSNISEGISIKKLFEESNGNLSLAIQMIDNSIANGYAGIFPIKNQIINNQQNGKKTPTASEQLEQFKSRMAEKLRTESQNQTPEFDDQGYAEDVY